MSRDKETLAQIDAPLAGAVLCAPPSLKFSKHATDYACSQCGVVLMEAEPDQVYELVIRCMCCGAYNKVMLLRD